MAYELITSRNMTEGMHVMFIYANDVTNGLFMAGFIYAFYLIITLGLYYSHKKLTGNGDIPQAMAVGGFSTFVFALILRLIPGMLNNTHLTIITVLATIGVFWFMTSREG